MTKILNRSAFKERRRELRINQTESEKILWMYLRSRKMNGYKFFRQYGVGSYILDFYCQKLHLAIELDGSQHNEDEQRAYDQERTRYLETLRIRVVRFWSNDVLRNIEGVLEAIAAETETPPNLLFPKEEEHDSGSFFPKCEEPNSEPPL